MVSFPISEDTIGQSGCRLLGININRLIRSHISKIRDLGIHDLRIRTLYRCLSFFRRKIAVYLCLHLCGNLFSAQIAYNICARIRCNRLGIICHILFRISADLFLCCIRILCLILLCYSVLDCILPNGKSNLLFRHCTELALKLCLDLRTVHCFHCSVNLIIMLVLLRIFRRHDRLVAHLVHDIGHIKRVVLRQPGVQRHDLLNVRLRSGVIYCLQRFISLCTDHFSVVLNAELIPVQEVHDHTGQVVIGIISASYILNGNACQSKHLAEYAQTVFSVVIELKIERTLYAEHVGIVLPLLLVLTVHTQNCLDLLLRQRNGFSVRVEDLDVLQFFLDRGDLRITLVNRIQFLFRQLHLVDVDLRRLDFGRIDRESGKAVVDRDRCVLCLFRRLCSFLRNFCVFLRFFRCFRSRNRWILLCLFCCFRRCFAALLFRCLRHCSVFLL